MTVLAGERQTDGFGQSLLIVNGHSFAKARLTHFVSIGKPHIAQAAVLVLHHGYSFVMSITVTMTKSGAGYSTFTTTATFMPAT